MDEINTATLRRLYFVSALAMAVLFFVSLFAPHLSHLRYVYLLYFIAFFAFAVVCECTLRRRGTLNIALGYTYCFLLYSFGLLIGTVYTTDSAVMFLVFILAVPLLFLVPVHYIYLFMFPAFGVFCAFTLYFKPTAAGLDITNGIFCLFIGLFLCGFLLQNRISIIALQEHLAEMCEMDDLTGIANRRSFNRYIERTYPKQAQLALVVADIDNFKCFNDTYGHMQGDDALKAVADTLAALAAENGLYVARFGGEEFVIADTDKTPVEFGAIVQQMLNAVYALDIPNRNAPFKRVSLSAGLATKAGTRTYMELLNRADEALYEAKRTGKNRIVYADGSVSTVTACPCGTHAD